MANPPKTPPSSDLIGVNRDARAGAPSPDSKESAGAVQSAQAGSAARPDENEPDENKGG